MARDDRKQEEIRKAREAAADAVAKGRQAKAIELYLKLEQLQPAEPEWPKKTGECHRRLGKNADAIAAFGRAADCYARGGFLLKAVAMCKQVLAIDPSHRETLGRLAKLQETPTEIAAPRQSPPFTVQPRAEAELEVEVDVDVDLELPSESTPAGALGVEAQVAPFPASPAATSPAAAPLPKPPAPPPRTATAPQPPRPPVAPQREPARAAAEPPRPAAELPRPPPPKPHPGNVTSPMTAAALPVRPPPPARAAGATTAAMPAVRPPLPAPAPASIPRAPTIREQTSPRQPSLPPGAPLDAIALRSLLPSSEPMAPRRTPSGAFELHLDEVEIVESLAPAALEAASLSPDDVELEPSPAPGGLVRSRSFRPGKTPTYELEEMDDAALAALEREALTALGADSLDYGGSEDPVSESPEEGEDGGDFAFDEPSLSDEPSDDAFAFDDVDVGEAVRAAPEQARAGTDRDERLAPVRSGPERSALERPAPLELAPLSLPTPLGLEDPPSSLAFDPFATTGDLGSFSDEEVGTNPAAAERARGVLPTTPLFSEVDPRTLERLIMEVDLEHRETGELICRAGDPSVCLYVVAEGAVDVVSEEREDVSVLRLEEGEFFGEIGLVTDGPCWRTVKAVRPTTLLVIRREAVSRLIDEEPSFLRVLLRFIRFRLVSALTRESPLFAPFDATERRAMVERFKFLEVDADSVVVEQGQQPEGLFIFLSGEAVVLRDGTEIGSLGSGDVFGETALLERQPVGFTVKTTRRSFALLMDARTFTQTVMAHPHVLMYVSELSDRKRPTTTASGDLFDPSDLLDFSDEHLDLP